MERLANKIVSEGLSVRSIEELIALSSPEQKKSKKSKSKANDGKYAELVERLEGALDTRVTIAGSNTGGKIVIEYADGQDLQRIVGVIS
jgi:ParB family chromosome partitioning protein